MAHLPLDHLSDSLSVAAQQVQLGGTYTHYKEAAKTYTVTQLLILESTDEVGVVYRANYDERISFVRPLQEWLEHVEYHGKQVSRFTPASSS